MRWLAALILVLVSSCESVAQPVLGPDPSGASASSGLGGDLGSLNPLSVLESASRAFPGGGSAAEGGGGEGGRGAGLSSAVSVMLLLTVITLAPAVILMCTCFVRMIIVLGLLKQAMGLQSIPPPQVTTALALFMTAAVMSPTIDRIRAEAVTPYARGEVGSVEELWERGKQPLRDFMFAQIDATGNWSSVYAMLEYRGVDVSEPERLTRADVDMVTLVPSFVLSELKTAFVMGFRVYLPFLVIDMVISSLLISMGMMMLPPVIISMPFKLLLFVLVDGWTLIVGSLMRSFDVSSPAGAVAWSGVGLPAVV
ncbi:MAG: flagellar type III secretion system pore protein FliP [Phycisphaeraceae bacterium]|nr:MAG: flagellar type III secretion system pore protein FliP [Phycisphaeraceae bacterium]